MFNNLSPTIRIVLPPTSHVWKPPKLPTTLLPLSPTSPYCQFCCVSCQPRWSIIKDPCSCQANNPWFAWPIAHCLLDSLLFARANDVFHCQILDNVHLLAHPCANTSNKLSLPEESNFLIRIKMRYSCTLSLNCHKFIFFSHKKPPSFSPILLKTQFVNSFYVGRVDDESWQYHCQTVCESLLELFITYFIIDPFWTLLKVLNNLYEKLQ
jgi:hypothetical protein